MKETEQIPMVKSRFAAARLNDIIKGLDKNRRDLMIKKGWGVLLDISAFSAPKGLLEWMIGKIDAELGEFRNPRNNTSIVFNKHMVSKVLGLPPGIKRVVLLGKHDESPYREFYKINFSSGRRAPIAHAEKLLEDKNLDDETWFRTFYLVVVSTYFCPGTGDMLSLEYLGSLGDSDLVIEYDWAEHIFQHTMFEIKAFQIRHKKAVSDGNTNFQGWCGSCLPWIAIVYMDHLDFPESTLSHHRLNYSLPRASHVTDADFKYVMKHDKHKLTLNAHSYGARLFRPFRDTPYATGNATSGNQQVQEQVLPMPSAANASLLGQDTPHLLPLVTNPIHYELPDYIRPIFEKHTSLWLKDMRQGGVPQLTKLYSKHMSVFASDVFAAMKTHATLPHGTSSLPEASTSYASPPRASTLTVSPQIDVEPPLVHHDTHISDPSCSIEAAGTQFWEEAARMAAELEKSAVKTLNREDPSSSTHFPREDQRVNATTRPPRRGDDIECPSFDLLGGQTWSQHLADNNNLSPQGVAKTMATSRRSAPIVAPKKDVQTNTGGEQPDRTQQDVQTAVMEATNPNGDHASILSIFKNTMLPNTNRMLPNMHASTYVPTVGTQTQDKKNRKKRAFLGNGTHANQKKIKVTDESKTLYNTYIIKRCIRKPVDNEERPPFVDYGNYHISYEDFRESLKPRGKVDKNAMEIFIRHFNLVCNIPTTSEPFCTKFAFSQSMTSKLIVDEEVFDPKPCLKEFKKVYKEHELKTKDMLYFAIVEGEHWVLVSIRLLHKQVSFLDSMRTVKKSSIYDKAHFLVNNFITLATYAEAFPKEHFWKYVQHNPQELRQQTTNFDCGIFVMLFMKHWDGKKMQNFSQDMFENRVVVVHMLMSSELNKADPTWVLNWK
ncbi:unnamed protein product [Alopecurus aequalis]